MGVISVDNTSLERTNLKATKEFTLKPHKNNTAVISVGNTSLERTALEATREFTPERNPMDVISVENTSLKCPT